MFEPGEYPDAEQFVTHIVQLKTVKPSEVAQVLASFSKNPAGIVPIDSNQLLVLRDYASNIRRMLDLIERVDVTPESEYKLEVIPIKYGKVADLFDTMNTNIVAKVDMLLAQVLIEGTVVAVNLTDSLDLGISWLQNKKQFDQNFTGAGGINNGPGFLSTITNFPSGLPQGFSYFGNLGKNYEVALQALAKDGRARILQRPRVQTSHAVPGVFFTGQTVPYVSGFYDYGLGTGTGISTRGIVELLQVGVTLKVTPFITPDGLVVLDVIQ